MTSDEVRALSNSEVGFQVRRYPEVSHLLTIHTEIGGKGRGRRTNLEVLNKSAIVLACAAWEAFCEELAAETLKHFAKHAGTSGELPLVLRKSVASEIKKNPHELNVWMLAGDQWRNVLVERANKIEDPDDTSLESPSSDKVDKFFQDMAGIENLSESWHWARHSAGVSRLELNAFVKLRNRIAHGAAPSSGRVLKREAERGLSLIQSLTERSVSCVDSHLKGITGMPLKESL